MKLVTNKFKLGGLHEKHVVALALIGSWRRVSVYVYFINSYQEGDEWPVLVKTVIYPKGQ